MTLISNYIVLQAQARECLFEKLELQSRDKRDIDVCLDLAQEAAQVGLNGLFLLLSHIRLLPVTSDRSNKSRL